MIRINLIKTRLDQGGGVSQDQSTLMATDLGGGGGGFGGSAETVKKVAVMLLFTVLIVVYEQYNIGELSGQLEKTRNEQRVLQAELVKKKQQASKMSNAQKQFEVIEKKISVLKDLGNARVRELKALDYIQSIIPEQVWLKEIKYPGDKFTLSGYAITDDDLNEFVQKIEARSYFKDVILLQAKDSKLDKGTVKEFEIRATLEKK